MPPKPPKSQKSTKVTKVPKRASRTRATALQSSTREVTLPDASPLTDEVSAALPEPATPVPASSSSFYASTSAPSIPSNCGDPNCGLCFPTIPPSLRPPPLIHSYPSRNDSATTKDTSRKAVAYVIPVAIIVALAYCAIVLLSIHRIAHPPAPVPIPTASSAAPPVVVIPPLVNPVPVITTPPPVIVIPPIVVPPVPRPAPRPHRHPVLDPNSYPHHFICQGGRAVGPDACGAVK